MQESLDQALSAADRMAEADPVKRKPGRPKGTTRAVRSKRERQMRLLNRLRATIHAVTGTALIYREADAVRAGGQLAEALTELLDGMGANDA